LSLLSDGLARPGHPHRDTSNRDWLLPQSAELRIVFVRPLRVRSCLAWRPGMSVMGASWHVLGYCGSGRKALGLLCCGGLSSLADMFVLRSPKMSLTRLCRSSAASLYVRGIFLSRDARAKIASRVLRLSVLGRPFFHRVATRRAARLAPLGQCELELL
jgi:hypothetical protein